MNQSAIHRQRKTAAKFLVFVTTMACLLATRIMGAPREQTEPGGNAVRPPAWTELFVNSLTGKLFPLHFAGRNNGNFIVFVTDGVRAQPMHLVRLGGSIRTKDSEFKLIDFEVKFDTTRGFKRDVSELTVCDVATGQQFTMCRNDDVDHPTAFATFTYLRMKKDFTVDENMCFTLPPENGVRYKILEIKEKEVKILKEDEKKEIIIRPKPL